MPWEKSFDVDEALAKATRSFWRNGYEATSLSTLLADMGIQKGSFYATFGSKHEILLDALRAYVQRRADQFERDSRRRSPREAIVRHLDMAFRESCGESSEMGCFLVNSALELAPRDRDVARLAREALAAHRAFLRGLIVASIDAGELPPATDPDDASAGLLAAVIGIRTMARAGMETAAIRAARDAALDGVGVTPPKDS